MGEMELFWPSFREINNCIKAEAESAHESLILAVHQSTPLAIRSTGAADRDLKERSEADLLHAFMTPDLPTGTLLLPITGASGVGKSHMIRWLDAQLRRTEEYEAGKLHIIRIPKSASLRRVVQLILNPLKGEQYDQLRDALQKAAVEVTTDSAGTRLRYGLDMALGQLRGNLYLDIKESIEKEEKKALQLAYAHADKLPSLFSDFALKEQYNGLLTSILTRAIEGKKVGEEKDQIPLFHPDDLILQNPRAILEAAKEVQVYYQRLANEAERKKAAEILNAVLDAAIGFAFNLGQSLGGKTLQDIFLDIREQLFKEGKELVLLIEDFAALAGIQDPLLKICIQEAIRDGKQVLCRMRTAVAVTDGDWSGRDTVLTRVHMEWRVQSKLSSDQVIIDKTIDLIGAYLNAARYGDEELRSRFAIVQRNRKADLFSWLPAYNPEVGDETLAILNAFGKSGKGHWLFPFNKPAIIALAKKWLREGSELVFNPRSIINGILRNVLLKRDLYESGEFPEANFEGVSASIFSSGCVAKSGLSELAKGRYRSLLCFWGGNPDSEDDLRGVSPLVPKAFGLAALAGMKGTASEISQVKLNSQARGETEGKVENGVKVPDEKKDQGQPSVKEDDELDNKATIDDKRKADDAPAVYQPPPEVPRWKSILEDWANSIPISQTDANQLRSLIGDGLKNYINWNALLLAPPSGKISGDIYFSICFAKGAHSAGRFEVVVADSNKDEDGALRKAFLSMIWYQQVGSWDYPGGEEDCLYYAALMERLAGQVAAWYRAAADQRIAPLGALLMWCNCILSVTPPGGNDPKEIVNRIWKRSVETPEATLEPNWDAARQACHRTQSELITALNYDCAAFQGDAKKKPYAIDAVRITNLLPPAGTDFTVQTITSLFSGSDALNAIKEVALLTRTATLKGRLAVTIQIVRNAEKTFSTLLAPDEDMTKAVRALNSLIADAQADGVSWPSKVTTGADDLKFFASGLVEADLPALRQILSNIVEWFEAEDYPAVACAIGRVDRVKFSDTVLAGERLTLFLSEMEKKVDEMTRQAAQNDPKPVVARITSLLGDFDEQLQKLQEAIHGAP